MVGTLVGATALLPIIGAYLGAIVGAIMVLTQSGPLQMLLFVVFIIVLQQIEGNLIYPKVVGSSVGLPGIWVLAAVTIGGSLNGIFGMLIGVPLAATIYRLLREDSQKRLVKKKGRNLNIPDGLINQKANILKEIEKEKEQTPEESVPSEPKHPIDTINSAMDEIVTALQPDDTEHESDSNDSEHPNLQP